VADLKKTALYYPEIAIPSAKWLRQAILFFDEIASIVPASIELWTHKQVEQLAQHDEPIPQFELVSEEIDFLAKNGHYRPIRPSAIIEFDSFERAALEDEFMSAFVSNQFQSELGDKAARICDTPVHFEKATPEMIDMLLAEGLVKPDNERQWFNFERSTANLYMTLLAKYLARNDWQNTVPCTSGDRSEYTSLAFRSGDASMGTCSANVLIKNALPCPAENTPLMTILNFKDKRKDELLSFRTEIAALESKIATANSTDEIKQCVQQFTDEKNKALSNLNRSFSEAFVDGTLQSLRSLTRLGSPTLWLSMAASVQGMNAITQLPLSATLTGAAVTGSIEVGVTFISRMQQRKREFRDSAFAYVYYVERELAK
jgi:hypothetical protein